MTTETNKEKKIKELPQTSDEFWDGEKQVITDPKKIPICETHNRNNWTSHIGYVDNKNGTFSCKYCIWGGLLPGYLRILDDKIIDLRTLNKD